MFLTIVGLVALVGLLTARSVRTKLLLLTDRVTNLEKELALQKARSAETIAPATMVPAAAVTPSKPAAVPKSPQPTAQPQLQVKEDGWERKLSENWMVLLGSITLALGGAFLVKFSIDQGLLSPLVRVSMGCLLGIGLMALGQWGSSRDVALRIPGLGASYVPAALVAAGATMVFASLFAAYALYDLLPPLVAFAGLASVALAAALLSLRHGPFVAALGLVGAYVVPALVRSDAPSAFGLFVYLMLIAAPMMALLRWRGWNWLAWIALAGSFLWVAIWLAAAYKPDDAWIVGSFLLLTFGIFVALRRGINRVPALRGLSEAPTIRLVVAMATGVVAAGFVLLALTADHSNLSWGFILAFTVAALAFAYRDQAFDLLPLIVATLVIVALATWRLPLMELRPGDWVRPAMPERASAYLAWASCFAALFGAVGFMACRRAMRPVRWAALSAAAPVVATAIVYWRFSAAGIDFAWVSAALLLALLLLAAAAQMARERAIAGMEAALGVYGIGVIAALALAATMGLEEAWLTVALSLILPGTGWIDRRIVVPGLRWAALVVAVAVLARLVFNPYVLDYPIRGEAAFNWLLYGYGIPALAFAVAAHFFRRPAADSTIQILQGGAILFAVLLVSLEIHHLMAGSLATASYDIAEQYLQSAAWLLFAAGLSLSSLRDEKVVRLAYYMLLWIAAAQVVLSQAIGGNPYLTGTAVGETPIVNMLLLGFALPAVLFGLHAYLAGRDARLRAACASIALGLALMWLTLEVRHSFAGSVLSGRLVEPAELYCYSLAWLIVSGLLLAAGLRYGLPNVRRAGMALLVVVVLKAFLIDMSNLDGIWRAFSFLGLGGALVAVGWFYRRYIGGASPSAPPQP